MLDHCFGAYNCQRFANKPSRCKSCWNNCQNFHKYQVLLHQDTRIISLQKISYRFEESIWKILPFGQDGLVLELRNKEKFTCQWKIIDLKQERIRYQHQEEGNNWWYSMVEAKNPYVICHQMKQGKTPETKELLLLDTLDPEKNQKLPYFQFNGYSSDGIELKNRNSEASNLKLEFGDMAQHEVSSPLIYKENNEHFDEFRQLIHSYQSQHALHQCEYLEFNERIIIGYYTQAKDLLDAHLLILDQEGRQLEHCQVGTGLQGIINGMFFVYQQRIIYIKNENEIYVTQ